MTFVVQLGLILLARVRAGATRQVFRYVLTVLYIRYLQVLLAIRRRRQLMCICIDCVSAFHRIDFITWSGSRDLDRTGRMAIFRAEMYGHSTPQEAVVSLERI
jgi:hypothetical protein